MYLNTYATINPVDLFSRCTAYSNKWETRRKKCEYYICECGWWWVMYYNFECACVSSLISEKRLSPLANSRERAFHRQSEGYGFDSARVSEVFLSLRLIRTRIQNYNTRRMNTSFYQSNWSDIILPFLNPTNTT